MYTFSYKILSYNEDRGFNVLYTPDDENCEPIAIWVQFPPTETEEEIHDQIIKAYPQEEWNNQKKKKNIDPYQHMNMVGQRGNSGNNLRQGNVNPFESKKAKDMRSKFV